MSQNPIKKLGLYTSPHLRTVRERIRISPSNDTPFHHTSLTEEQFVQYFCDVWGRLGLTEETAKSGPPFARFLTLMALHGFLQEKVDTAVVEVCLGGRHDSTNILHRPSVSAITSLALEHTDLLGNYRRDRLGQGRHHQARCPDLDHSPSPRRHRYAAKDRSRKGSAADHCPRTPGSGDHGAWTSRRFPKDKR